MCHLSIKVFDMFDQTSPHTHDKKIGKTYFNEKQSQNKGAGLPLVTGVQLMCQPDYE